MLNHKFYLSLLTACCEKNVKKRRRAGDIDVYKRNPVNNIADNRMTRKKDLMKSNIAIRLPLTSASLGDCQPRQRVAVSHDFCLSDFRCHQRCIACSKCTALAGTVWGI